MYYGTRNSLHPLINIFLSIFIFTFGLFLRDLNQVYCFNLFIIIIILLSGYFLTFIKFFFIFILMGFFVALFSYIITQDFFQSIFSICRLSIIGLSVVFTLNVNPTDLSRALTQIHCPRKVSLAILITFRFIPVLRYEVNRIAEAMKVRGVKFHWWNPFQYYRVLFLPLIIRIINISDTLALSIETRGFSSNGISSYYKKVILTKKDLFLSFLTIFGTFIILILF